MSIGTLLRVLFSLMSFLVIGLLLQPIWGDLGQRTESEVIVRHARAARVIFSALQNLRTERGPTRTTLEAEDPASVNFIAITDALRAKSQTALVAVQQECTVIDCAGAKPEISAGLRGSVEKLVAIRKEVDSALPVSLRERRPNVAHEFNMTITDLIDRLERMSKVVGERVRMADAETAELIEIKELAWLARDGVGLERTALIDGLNSKALSPAMRTKATGLRARAEVTWTMVGSSSASGCRGQRRARASVRHIRGDSPAPICCPHDRASAAHFQRRTYRAFERRARSSDGGFKHCNAGRRVAGHLKGSQRKP